MENSLASIDNSQIESLNTFSIIENSKILISNSSFSNLSKAFELKTSSFDFYNNSVMNSALNLLEDSLISSS